MGCLLTFFLIIIIFNNHHSLYASQEITNFIFKGCANQNFQDQSGPKNLNTLLTTLTQQSSQKSFSTATAGDGATTVTGLYQCRGDLTLSQCNSCVEQIPSLLKKHCGDGGDGATAAEAARIQLNGCYLMYEVVGFRETEATELLYKVCGSQSGGGVAEGAVDMVINGVKSNGGFYTGSYGNGTVYVLGQCEGDLSSGDCGDCVKIGFDSVKSQCGGGGNNSVGSAQIYLNKCYISFRYYPNGVPKISDGDGGADSSSSGMVTKRHTQRTVALAVGGTAALGFLVVIFLFVISALKKKQTTSSSSSSKKHGGGWN
ncbi:hypothetical protein ACFE04_012238 [Oxalis oulophora]